MWQIEQQVCETFAELQQFETRSYIDYCFQPFWTPIWLYDNDKQATLVVLRTKFSTLCADRHLSQYADRTLRSLLLYATEYT